MILYINTEDARTVTVALKNSQKILDCLSMKNKYGSQILLPSIIKILKKNKLQFSDLTDIEVTTGPGSYTGLRVGVSVAQALGLALNIPVNGLVNKPVELQYT